jgi:hypothetical protein
MMSIRIAVRMPATWIIASKMGRVHQEKKNPSRHKIHLQMHQTLWSHFGKVLAFGN